MQRFVVKSTLACNLILIASDCADSVAVDELGLLLLI